MGSNSSSAEVFKEGFMEEVPFELDLERWFTYQKVLPTLLFPFSAPILTFQIHTLFLPV